MNPKQDAFTDASQLDNMNRTVWKTLGGHHKTVGNAPPELDDSLPSAQSTPLVGDAEEAELEVRVNSLQTELLATQVEKELLVRTTESSKGELSRGRTEMEELRGADAAIPVKKASRP